MEVGKKLTRELFQSEPIQEDPNRLTVTFGDFRIQITLDFANKTLVVASIRPVQLHPKEAARKAQQACLSFLPGVVLFDENSFKLVTSSLFFDAEQMEELLRTVLELHKDRAMEVYGRFIDS